MIIGVSLIELFIPQAQSLKDKRRVVKSLTQRVSHRFNVSISEVGGHTLRQRAAIAVAHVSNKKTDVEKLLHTVITFAEETSEGEIIRSVFSYYDPEKD